MADGGPMSPCWRWPTIAAVKRTSQESGDRLPFLITVGVFVVMLACLPLVLRVDAEIDGDRPMYLDMERMLNLQTGYVATTGQPPVETRLSGGESVVIGETEFVASDGVTLNVRTTDEGSFCISANNQEGTSSERCSE